MKRKRVHHGFALALVLMVMALAAVLSYAMLTNSTLQATASSNGVGAFLADAQAQSGLQLAKYYLLHPSNAPASQVGNGFWQGAGGITFSTTGSPAQQAPGSVTVTVARIGTSTNYTVTSVGSSGATGTGTMTRTMTATISVNEAYVIQEAAAFNSAITVSSNMTFSGAPYAIISDSTIKVSGGTVKGNVLGSALQWLSGLLEGLLGSPPASPPAPAWSNVTDFRTYTYQGATYNATELSNITIAAGTTLGPTVSNPAGVYWANGNIHLQNNVTINGTLIAETGNVAVQGTNIVINAQPNMPALIVNQYLDMKTANEGITINGVAFLEEGIIGAGAHNGSNLIIDGALLTDTGTVSKYTGVLSVTFNPNNTSVPNLSTANLTPSSVKMTAWSQ